jgi:hypothetical protein
VIGLVAADPGWQLEEVARRPEIRGAIADGTRPQARELTARERDDLCRMVMLLTGEFLYQDRPSLRGPPSSYLTALTGGDVARLNLIAAVITPRSDDVDHRVVMNEADWKPPVDIPSGWQIASAPRPSTGHSPGKERTGGTASTTPPSPLARTGRPPAGLPATPTTRGRSWSPATTR